MGKTWSPEDSTGLVEERLSGTLHDDAWVHPGHWEGTTLGADRPHLAEERARGW